MDLDHYFKTRQIESIGVAAAVSTPLRFSDSRLEHLATRNSAGLFDFSFMTCIAIRGAQSVDLLERIQVRNIRQLQPGRIAYTMMCRQDGTVIDDATIWCRSPNEYWMFVGVGPDRTHVEELAADYDVEVSDRSRSQCVMSLQGPASFRILQRVFPAFDLGTLPYYRFRIYELDDTTLCLARIGDCGELGYELVVAAEAGPALWQRLLVEGAPFGLLECGFRAADSLRIEAGHILFSRTLAVTPYELGFGRLIRHDGVPFLGYEALSARRFTAPSCLLTGLLPIDSGAAEFELLAQAAKTNVVEGFASMRPGVAHLHSVCMSPITGRALALGFVAYGDHYAGTRVMLSNRKKASVARIPFYDPTKTLPRAPPIARR